MNSAIKVHKALPAYISGVQTLNSIFSIINVENILFE